LGQVVQNSLSKATSKHPILYAQETHGEDANEDNDVDPPAQLIVSIDAYRRSVFRIGNDNKDCDADNVGNVIIDSSFVEVVVVRESDDGNEEDKTTPDDLDVLSPSTSLESGCFLFRPSPPADTDDDDTSVSVVVVVILLIFRFIFILFDISCVCRQESV
jgi:hypothetical protein